MTTLGTKNPLVRIANAVRATIAPRRIPDRPERDIQVIGHRGTPYGNPENTLGSFREAVAEGADGLETDICVTRDGVWVLWHDIGPNNKLALARQIHAEEYPFAPDAPPLGSEWRRPVAELTLEELRAHYGYLRNGGDGRRIPIDLLEDLLAWAASQPRLKSICLDIKLGPHQADRIPELLRWVAPRARAGLSFDCLSTHREVVTALLQELKGGAYPPDLFRAVPDFELPGVLRIAKKLGASCVSVSCSKRMWAAVRDELVGLMRARDEGKLSRVLVWTCNKPKELALLRKLRVDGIITDHPALLRRILAERPPAEA